MGRCLSAILYVLRGQARTVKEPATHPTITNYTSRNREDPKRETKIKKPATSRHHHGRARAANLTNQPAAQTRLVRLCHPTASPARMDAHFSHPLIEPVFKLCDPAFCVSHRLTRLVDVDGKG
ncbi:hypothetical protein IWX46DRAFT_587348 [Phyllosticta citricarpa]|uniref:Uncharacterized protein n=1 Tax=Phyllosticta citricarpa TaxID=55181 RepID=A0ABR1MP59_9PEZI